MRRAAFAALVILAACQNVPAENAEHPSGVVSETNQLHDYGNDVQDSRAIYHDDRRYSCPPFDARMGKC